MEREKSFIWPYAEPPLYEPLWLEKFDVVSCRDWMEKNWHWSVYICIGYVVIAGLGEQLMKTRPPFDLRYSLAVWNLSMALFSAFGFIRCFPELLLVLKGPNGFHRSICVRDNHTQAAAFWAWAFTWSKVFELGDTFFVIARKKETKFIHFYHHVVALVMCWCYYSDYEPIARWFGIINFAVHTILYSYLFLKAMGVTVHPVFAKWIISIELAQMIVGLIVNSYALSMKFQGVHCARNPKAIGLQMATYASFVLIFAYLFRHSSTRIKYNKEDQEKKTS